MNATNATWLVDMLAQGFKVKSVHVHVQINNNGEIWEENQKFGTDDAARIYQARLNEEYGRDNVNSKFIYDTYTINFDTSDI